MEENNVQKSPKFLHLLIKDYNLGTFLFLSIMTLGVGIYFYFDRSIDFIASIISLVVSIFSLIGFLVRLKNLKQIFEDDQKVEGEVVKITITRREAYIKFIFNYQGDTITCRTRSYKSRSRELQKSITVLINKKKLKRSIIQDLYTF